MLKHVKELAEKHGPYVVTRRRDGFAIRVARDFPSEIEHEAISIEAVWYGSKEHVVRGIAEMLNIAFWSGVHWKNRGGSMETKTP